MEETQEPSSSSRSTYHIFLSFRGADTRTNFTDHLYTALCNAGFRTFRDDDEIQKGQPIAPILDAAIQQSTLSLILFSTHYASSKWCLNELLRILERRKAGNHSVFPIFYDVKPTEVGNQKGKFQSAFDKYEESGEEFKDKVDRWREALREVSKLGGKVLQDEANGHEAVFIQTIVKEVGIILKRTVLAVASYTVGVESRVRDIDLWLKDSSDVGVGVISGMRGIGKTTIVKVAYNLNFADFEASSFLANVRGASEQQYGLVRLQSQLLSDISKGKTRKIYNIHEGIVKIQDALCRKRILLVLDDVDQTEQLDALIGSWDSFLKGSKVIITTSRERLLSYKPHNTYRIEELNRHESLQLFCWHAFMQDGPKEGYLEHSERVVRRCEGLPLALQVLGSSLKPISLEFWISSLEKLEAILDERIRKTLEVSYKSLHDDHDKRLFLLIASSFVGKDKDYAVKELEESEFYSKVGMQNLMDRSLVTVDKDNKLIMHHLVRDMARAIIRQESVDKPHIHNFHNSDTVTSEGSLSYKQTPVDDGRKRKRNEDFENELMPSTQESSFKRRCLGFISWFRPATSLMKLLMEQRM